MNNSHPNSRTGGGDQHSFRVPDELMLAGASSTMDTVVLTADEIKQARQSAANKVAPHTIDAPVVANLGPTIYQLGPDADELKKPDLELLHFDQNGDLQVGELDDQAKQNANQSMIRLAEAMRADEKLAQKDLITDRNALASLIGQRRKETFTSKLTKKESAARYEELSARYGANLQRVVDSLPKSISGAEREKELERLSHAEEVYRSGDQEKIAELFNVNYDEYKDIIAKELEVQNVTLKENNAGIKTYDALADFADAQVVDRWSELSRKQKFGATFGATALTAATIAVLPIGGAIVATGAAGAGVMKVTKSAIKKSVMHKITTKDREQSRDALVDNVTDIDTKLSDDPNSPNSILDIVNARIEADKQDNNRTIRKIGYSALAGVVTGGVLGVAFGWAKDALGDNEVVKGIAESARNLFSPVEDLKDDINAPDMPVTIPRPSIPQPLIPRPNIPALDADMPETETPTELDREVTITSSDADMPELDDSTELDREVSIPESDADMQPDIDTEVEVDDIVQDTDIESDTPDSEVEIESEAPEVEIEQPADLPESEMPTDTEPVDVVETPEVAPNLDTIQINVNQNDGFQQVFKNQYGLNDQQSWQAYLAVKPHLGDQAGVYTFGDDFRLSGIGPLELNPQASGALRDFLETIEDEDILEDD